MRRACSAKEQIVFDVRPATAIRIELPTRVSVGDGLTAIAKAFDANGNALVLGDEAPLEWTFGGALVARPLPSCGDILPICPALDNGYASAVAEGAGSVEVALGALRARARVDVGPAASAR